MTKNNYNQFDDPDGPASKAWFRRLYDMLADHGIWAVPRSGLIFRKQSGCMVLIDRMPYDPRMPCSAAELQEQQDDEVAGISRHFAAIGIEVK